MCDRMILEIIYKFLISLTYLLYYYDLCAMIIGKEAWDQQIKQVMRTSKKKQALQRQDSLF